MGLFDGVPAWALILGGAALGIFLFWMIWKQNQTRRKEDFGTKPAPKPEERETPRPDTTKSGKTLILFRMEGCGPCMAFLPTWGSLQKNLQGKCNFEEYERSANADLLEKYAITGFPTIIIRSEDGTEKKFEGPRDEKHITEALFSS